MPIPLTTCINLRADLLRRAEKRYLFVQRAEKLQQPEDYWRSGGHAASKLPRRARSRAFQMRLGRVKSIETSAQPSDWLSQLTVHLFVSGETFATRERNKRPKIFGKMRTPHGRRASAFETTVRWREGRDTRVGNDNVESFVLRLRVIEFDVADSACTAEGRNSHRVSLRFQFSQRNHVKCPCCKWVRKKELFFYGAACQKVAQRRDPGRRKDMSSVFIGRVRSWGCVGVTLH